MKNYHIITVKYLGATRSYPERIKLTSKRFEQSFTVGRDTDFTFEEQAKRVLEHMEYNIIGGGEYGADEHIIITDTFKGLK